jgi:hypothetical protein
MFWKLNISNLRSVFLLEKESAYDIFTDASDVGAVVFHKNSHLVMFKKWLTLEAGKSSTWREIKAAELIVLYFNDVLKGSSVTCYTDNQNAASIILKGRKVHELQSLALTIFEFCAKNDTQIHTVWMPREQNTQADYLSRILDIDDWAISTEFFHFINEIWGPHSVDIFASSNNAKTKLFNSLYWNPGYLGVSSFNSDWSQDVNWFVPTVPLASRSINHFVKCKAKGTLIVPKWTSPPF